MTILRKSPSNLVWLDLEMTGLDADGERILEVAVVVTDRDLKIRKDGPCLVINQADSVLDSMDMWNRGTHGKSGLTERSRLSLWDEEMAEEKILHFLKEYVPADVSPMCGNVLTKDREFLKKYMPRLHAYFSYKDLDANCLEIMAKAWCPNVATFVKRNQHSALADIHEAIDKMQYYRRMLFK